jgi:hypothetical protein
MSLLQVNQIAPFTSDGISIGAAPSDSNAILELNSTTQGFKFPRMTTIQRDAIISPNISLTIYNTDNKRAEAFDGIRWKSTGGAEVVSNILYVSNLGTTTSYQTISSALNAVTSPSESNPWLIYVGPGIYIEPLLSIPSYVSVIGATIERTVVQPDTANHHVFVLDTYAELSFLSIQNAGTGYAGIACVNAGNYTQMHKVSIYNCDIGVYCESSTLDSNCYLEYVDINGMYTYAVQIVSTNGFECFVNAENFYIFPDAINVSADQILIDGTAATMEALTCGIHGNGADNGIRVTNGATLSINGVYFFTCLIGIYADNTGTDPKLKISGTSFENCTTNFNIANTTATGNYTGFCEYSKKSINDSNSFFITNKDMRQITVMKKGGDFTSLATALASITDSSSTNPYLIAIGPGIFTEPVMDIPTYVTLEGSAITTTIIQPDAANHHVFHLTNPNADIGFLTIQGAGAGYCGVFVDDIGYWALLHKVSIYNCDISVKIESTTQDSYLYLEYVDIDELYNKALEVVSNNGFISYCNAENFYCYPTNESMTGANIDISGEDSEVHLITGGIEGNGTGIGVSIIDGGSFSCQATYILNCDVGIQIPNTGSGPYITVNARLENITYDIEVLNPNTTGNVGGILNISKVSVDSSCVLGMNYSDHGTAGLVVLQDIYQGDIHDRLINISKLIRAGSTVGWVSGGEITRTTGLGISVALGNGFLIDQTDGLLKEVNWVETPLTLTASSSDYIFVNSSGVVTHSTSLPSFRNIVFLGRAFTLASSIDYIAKSVININQHGNAVEDYQRTAIGPVYVSGSTVIENTSNAFQLDIAGGNYYYGTKQYLPSGGSNVTFEARYKAVSGWNYVASQTAVNHTQYDDGTGTLHDLTTGYYAKHSLYTVGDGTEEKYILFISQAEYANLSAAQLAGLPSVSTDIINSVTLIADIIIKEGDANIIQIDDQRPRMGFKPSSLSAVGNHPDLSGLITGDSGHTQFLMRDGTKAMSGNLDMGGGNVTNVGRVDGVTVSSHGNRHIPNGLDALTTAAPLANLTSVTTNATGTANSLARSDHSHAITTGAPSTQNTDQANAAGSSASLSKADHIHNIPTATPVSIGATNAQGSSTSFAKADHVHQVLTGNGITLSTATIVPSYGTPVAQAPDQTNAQGATNTLADAAHIHNIPTAVPVTQNTDQTNTKGTSTSFARADHVHNIPTATPSALSTSTTNTQGSSTSFAKADHLHAVSIINSEASATADTTTTSSSDVLINAMTLTPVAGTYLVIFSTVLENNNTGSNVYVSIWSGGSQVAHSERRCSPQFTVPFGSASLDFPISTNAIVTVNGSQAIEARWRRTGGTATAHQRTINIIKLNN